MTSPVPENEMGFYRAAMQFIDDYAVEFIAVEVIIWLPEHGLAGTADWIARIANKVVLGDWKSRAKRHGAYPEEVAQVGTYSMGKHLVVGAFPGKLLPMPETDSLMITSLMDDGSYAAYPVDLELARESAGAMVAAWEGSDYMAAYGQRAIGAPLKGQAPPMPQENGLLQSRRMWVRTRVRSLPSEARDLAARLWPRDIPMKADVLSHEQIDSVAKALDEAEAEHEAPFFDLDPATPPPEPGSAKSRRTKAAGTNKKADQ